MFGPSAVPALAAFLADPDRGVSARWGVIRSLELITKEHPETRAEFVNLLVRQLERAPENDPTLNGALIDALCELQEVAAAPLMERAFAEDLVDEMIIGDWEDVRYRLGLRPDKPQHRPRPLFDLPPLGGAGSPRAKAAKRAKAKRKEAKKARKRNRKKK